MPCKTCNDVVNLCAEKFPNTCGIWQGPNIPCLDICTGDKLSDAEEAMAEMICEILKDIDVSAITTCTELTSILTGLGEKNVANFIKALSQFSCSIRTALTALQNEFNLIKFPGVTLPSCFSYLLSNPCIVNQQIPLVNILNALLDKVCILMNKKHFPTQAPVIYIGSLANFSGTGVGLVGTQVEGWLLCNGQNGTPLSTSLPQVSGNTIKYIIKLT